MRILLSALACCFAMASAEIEEYSLSREECRAAGFVPETLKKYPMAHIEVCECNLARFPQVQGKFTFLHSFVRENMASHWGGKVRVRQVRGVRPQIKLKDDAGITKQTLNIEKWDTDTITDFLNQWIE
ncbi:Sep15/SelM redox domain protein [Ancylostoma caninum]|uniref:Selenoprotein F n=2 Tax=Ancylostoma TaxID=29169 RepID=A0A368G4S0_ANCCA|nr:Sep15/SelM redox domain protein [Ancylostoma caninum]